MLAAVAGTLLAMGPNASACEFTGTVLCSVNGASVQGYPVTITPTDPTQFPTTVWSDSTGSFLLFGQVGLSYNITVGSGTSAVTVATNFACTAATLNDLGPIAITDLSACPSAGCSPGFYKNRTDLWCAGGTMPAGVTCGTSCRDIVCKLSAEFNTTLQCGRSPASVRNAVTSCMNDFFPASICPGG